MGEAVPLLGPSLGLARYSARPGASPLRGRQALARVTLQIAPGICSGPTLRRRG